MTSVFLDISVPTPGMSAGMSACVTPRKSDLTQESADREPRTPVSSAGEGFNSRLNLSNVMFFSYSIHDKYSLFVKASMIHFCPLLNFCN